MVIRCNDDRQLGRGGVIILPESVVTYNSKIFHWDNVQLCQLSKNTNKLHVNKKSEQNCTLITNLLGLNVQHSK